MNNPAQIVFNIPELKRLIYDFDTTYKKEEYNKVIQELNQKFYKSILIANFRGDYFNYKYKSPGRRWFFFNKHFKYSVGVGNGIKTFVQFLLP